MTDEEVVTLVQKGDKEKFGEIIERYENKLFGYLKGFTNQDTQTVEDLVEETLIKAYKNIKSFDCKQKFSSWVYRIGHNMAIDFFRKQKTYRLDEWTEDNIVDTKKISEEIEIEKETNTELMKAIKKLELKYRDVIWLYYFEDKSYDEISDILHVTSGNVGVMMGRAKVKLKKVISNK